MHICMLREMIGNCTAMEELFLICFKLHLEREDDAYIDEDRNFGLERHAGSLKRITISESTVQHAPPPSGGGGAKMEVDLRWLHLPVMSALEGLELCGISPRGYALSELPTLPSLKCLALVQMDIDDAGVQALIPSLPGLHSVKFSSCGNLTYRVLQFLPAHLDILDVSFTKILTPSAGVEEPDFLVSRHGVRAGKGSVKRLVVEGMAVGAGIFVELQDVDPLRFEAFLECYDAATIFHYYLTDSILHDSDGLVYFLSKATGLQKLDLSRVTVLDKERVLDRDIFSSVSKLASLRELNLDSTSVTHECLAILAEGPCRKSLRKINLRGCLGIEDRAGVRRLFSDLFDNCDVCF